MAMNAKAAHEEIKKMKLEVQETEQKKNGWEENRQKISKAVALAHNNFKEEGITKEIT